MNVLASFSIILSIVTAFDFCAFDYSLRAILLKKCVKVFAKIFLKLSFMLCFMFTLLLYKA